MTEMICPPHRWVEDAQLCVDAGGYLCSACGARTVGCVECRRPVSSALLACDRCLERGQRLVLDVVEDMERFPFTVLEIIGLRGIRYDPTAVRTSEDDVRLPFGMDRYVDDLECPAGMLAGARSPQSATETLLEWARYWRDVRGDSVRLVTLDYLAEIIPWAIQNQDRSDWKQFVTEARAVRATVRRILGIAPVREQLPCPSCGGGPLVRDWLPRATSDTPACESAPVRRRPGLVYEGLADEVRCTECRLTWPTPERVHQLALATLKVASKVRPYALVTAPEAADLFRDRIAPAIIRQWVRRGVLVPALVPGVVLGPWSLMSPDPEVKRFVLADVEQLVLRAERLAAERAEREAAEREQCADTQAPRLAQGTTTV